MYQITVKSRPGGEATCTKSVKVVLKVSINVERKWPVLAVAYAIIKGVLQNQKMDPGAV